MPVHPNHYETLGIESDADFKEINRAFRKLALAVHPDKNPSADATEKFKVISNAHDVLHNEDERYEYDISLGIENLWHIKKLVKDNKDDKNYYKIRNLINLEVARNPDKWQKNPIIQNAVRDVISQASSLLEFFLNKNFNPNIRIQESDDVDTQFPLIYFAAKENKLAYVRVLIEHKAEIKPYSTYNQTGDNSAIIIAVKKGHRSMVEYLLSEGASTTCTVDDEKLSLLAMAAKLENEKLIELLIQNGASIYEAIKSAEQQFEIDNDPIQYKKTLQTLLDYGFGIDLPKSEKSLSFLKKINVKGLQLAGISIHGKPITHDILKKYQIEGEEDAYITFGEIDNITDDSRRNKLLKRLNQAKDLHNGYTDSDDIINLVPLVHAVRTGDLRAVKARLEAKNADPNHSGDYSSLEPIYFAAKKGFTEIAEALISHSKFDNKTLKPAIDVARLNEKEDVLQKLLEIHTINDLDEKGYSKLHHAVAEGNIPEIKRLIAMRADVNLKAHTDYPLTIAAHHDNVEIIRLLIANDAFTGVNVGGRYIIDYASDIATIRELIPYFSKKYLFWYRETAFKALKSPQCLEIFQLLKAENASFNLHDYVDGTTLLHHVLKTIAPLSSKTEEFYQQRQRFNFLMENDVDVNIQNYKGNTPIHELIKNSNEENTPFLIKIIEQCVIKGFDIHASNKNHISLLHLAVAKNNIPLVKYLIARNADINAQDKKGCTPLHYAAVNDPTLSGKKFTHALPLMMEYLLKQTDANPKIVNHQGLTPLEYLKKEYNEIINDPDRSSFLCDFFVTQGMLELPCHKIQKTTPINVLSKELREYKIDCKGLPNYESIFSEYKLSPLDQLQLDLYRDDKTHRIMQMPVKLHEHIYDYATLQSMFFKEEVDPYTKQKFQLSEITPAPEILEEIQKLAALFKEKYKSTPRKPSSEFEFNTQSFFRFHTPKRKHEDEEEQDLKPIKNFGMY